LKVISVNIGGAGRLSFDGAHLQTGIFKSSVEGPAFLTQTGFRGDVQVDRKNHGGPDKAVCVYCADHFDEWEDVVGYRLPPGAFGENLTVTGMDEKTVRIGDVYSVGECELQVSQPRQPCQKLAKKVGDLEFSNRVIALGLTGFYFRVLKEGRVAQGDAITIESTNEDACSIAYANGVLYDRLEGASGIERLLAEPALSSSWRQVLSARRS
jgi:MOSC domain-containing protein YiiM